MRQIFLYLLLIGNILLSPLMATEDPIDSLEDQIIEAFGNLTGTQSYFDQINAELNKLCSGTSTDTKSNDGIGTDKERISFLLSEKTNTYEDINVENQILDELLSAYKRLTGVDFILPEETPTAPPVATVSSATTTHTDHLTQGILQTYEEIRAISIRFSALRAYKTRIEQRSGKTLPKDHPVSTTMCEVTEKLFLAQENLDILIEQYKAIAGTRFTSPSLIKRPPYTPNVQELTLNSHASSGVSGKFTTTSTGLPTRKKTIQEPSESHSSDFLNQLNLNLKDEHTHLAKLKELLKRPEYQDQTSSETQQLLYEITESTQIINYYQDCLLQFMYPTRSIESLKEEAQNNSLGSVKLVLHKNGYFHIPEPSLTPYTPRKRRCNGLKRTAKLDDFSSCGLSNTPSGNSSFVSVTSE